MNYLFIVKEFQKPFSYSSLVLLIIVLPLNITVQFQTIFSNFPIEQFFVEGRAVNFLLPYISILDMVGLILIAVNFIESGFSIFKKYRYFILSISGYFFIHILLHLNFITIFSSLRFVLILLVAIIVIELIAQIFAKNINSISVSKTIKYKQKNIFIKLQNFKKELFVKLKVSRSQLIVFLFLFLIASIQIIIAVFQFYRGSSLGLNFIGESEIVANNYGSSFFEYNGQSFLRGYGTFPHPNLLGGFFVFFMIVSSGIFGKQNILRYLLNILIMFGIIFTFSRTALVLAFVVLISNFVFDYLQIKYRCLTNEDVDSINGSPKNAYKERKLQDRKSTQEKIDAVSARKNIINKSSKNILKSIITKIPVFFIPIFSRFPVLINFSNNTDKSISERYLLIEASYQVIKDNFFFGAGWGYFIKAMEDFVPITYGGFGLYQPVHNIFLLILSENGIVGSLVVVAILLIYSFPNIKFFINSLFVKKHISFLQYWLIISIICVLTLSFVDHYLLTLPQGIFILCVFIALLIRPNENY